MAKTFSSPKPMRAWAISLAAVFALLLLLPLALSLFAFALPCCYGDTFLGELKYKYARLRDTAGPRIVTVGGSAAAFGQVSSLIEQELPGYTAVNFGMYAALGTAVMLDLSLPHICEGDIVILSPEQNAQTLSESFNAEAMWQGLDGAFYMLEDISPENYEALLGQFPAFAAAKCRYTLTGDPPQGTGAYARSAFDEYGDIAYAGRTHNEMPGGADTNMPVSFAESVISAGFIDALNGYADACRKKGAQVYYRFCPVNGAAVEDGADIDAYYDFLREELSFPILGDPHRSVLEREWFYDTNFHLNEAGAQLNTLYQSLSLAISSVFTPRVNRLVFQERNNDQLNLLFARVGRIQFIVLALVLSGFLVFGREFIRLWAGDGYDEAYVIALLLMGPVTVPLIQNLGIEIQRAKNMHKARSVAYLLVAVGNVLLSIPLIHLFGATGAALGTAVCLFLGNILFMNIYYQVRIQLDMRYFWKEIFKLCPAVLITAAAGMAAVRFFPCTGWIRLVAYIFVYVLIYAALMWLIGMNRSEKDLVRVPLQKIRRKLCRK